MWYEINVSKNGMHFFATHERSIQTETELIEVLKEFRESFKEENGFKIIVSKWKSTGQNFSNEEIENMLAQNK